MVADREYIKSILPIRAEDANKYSVGTLLCVCGSVGMAGAAILSARAAYRMGAGLVRCVVPEGIYPIIAAAVPEAVFTVLPQTDEGCISSSFIDEILRLGEKSDAVLMGCGCRITEDTKAIAMSLAYHQKKPLILDADGINAISKHIDVLRERVYPTVLTPHEGEMSRLSGISASEIRADRAAAAQSFSDEYDVVTVLKGKDTIIASKGAELVENPTGNASMAKAGSGDVLAGMIGALVAQGAGVREASVAGVYLHGLAGDMAVDKLTVYSVNASDLIAYIPDAIRACI